MTLHPLRQAAPQMVAMAEAMPETPMMEAMPTAAHPTPPPPPIAAETVIAPRIAPSAPRSGLFADASRAVSVEQSAEGARPSLFSTVTGAFRRRQHHAPAVTAEPAPVRADPAPQDPRTEQPRVSVRQTAGDEVEQDDESKKKKKKRKTTILPILPIFFLKTNNKHSQICERVIYINIGIFGSHLKL